jgi:IS1 family transposase
MDWVKQVGKLLPDSYNPETIPEVGELDELETFVGQKKNKIWIGTAVDHFRDGILGWVMALSDQNMKDAMQSLLSK